MCAGERVTIVGTPDDDVIRGTAHADVIDGLAGGDVINGLGGNDTICGNYGTDDLRGNAGRDRLYGGADGLSGFDMSIIRGDSLRGGSGNDTLVPGLDTRGATEVVPDWILYDTAPRGVTVDLGAGTATGDGSDRLAVNGSIQLSGTPFGDHIVGTPFVDFIYAGLGADRVWGAGGGDWISVGRQDLAPDDSLPDTAYGGPGDDRLSANGGADRLVGGTGEDQLRDESSSSVDVLEGGDDDDRLDDASTQGLDVLLGQDGRDSLGVKIHPNMGTVDGGPGPDEARLDANGIAGNPPATLVTGTGHVEISTPTPIEFDVLETQAFVLSGLHWNVTGSAGRDFVNGDATLSTTMSGLGADDALAGSAGNDTFNGGTGTDCFHRDQAPDGTDTLTDVETIQVGSDRCPWLP